MKKSEGKSMKRAQTGNVNDSVDTKDEKKGKWWDEGEANAGD